MVPFLGTLNIRCRIIRGIQRGTIILTTTHIQSIRSYRDKSGYKGFRVWGLRTKLLKKGYIGFGA